MLNLLTSLKFLFVPFSHFQSELSECFNFYLSAILPKIQIYVEVKSFLDHQFIPEKDVVLSKVYR